MTVYLNLASIINLSTQYCIGPWSLCQGLFYANAHLVITLSFSNLSGQHAHIFTCSFRFRGNLAIQSGYLHVFERGNWRTQRKATQTQLWIISVEVVWQGYLHIISQVCLAMVSMVAVSLWLRVSWCIGMSHVIPAPALTQSLQPAVAAVPPLTEQGIHTPQLVCI